MDAITLTKVTKTFGTTTAVNDLSLKVPKGSVYGFIGPNGSGKTTTLRMILNIFYPDSGNIQFPDFPNGAGVSDRIGYMPEERGIYTRMKVADLLKFMAALKGKWKIGAEIDQWLKRLDLDSWANRKVETLSKGMSQKVQFLATIVARPNIVILDEPFSGLDPVNSEAIREIILELQKDGATVIFSTHDMNVAERMCDFIFMIHKGKKVLDGTLSSIQDEYGTDTVRLRAEGGVKHLQDLAQVEKVIDFGQEQQLKTAPGCDHRQLLTQILERTTVLSFDVIKPSLNDIFIRIAGPTAGEKNYA